MNADQLCQLAASLPGATMNVQWENNRVFKIGDKMFAVAGPDADSRYSFKVDDDRFLALTGLPGVHPAPYLARAKWVQIEPAVCALTRDELSALVRDAYEIILARLPKKTQKAIRGR